MVSPSQCSPNTHPPILQTPAGCSTIHFTNYPESAQTPQVEGLVPQNWPIFKCQSWVPDCLFLLVGFLFCFCLFLYWSIVNLQYCVSFRCAAMWFSYPYTYILKKEMATHSSILALRIPWTEEPGRLQSMESQRVGHDWVTNAHTYIYSFSG